MRRPIAVVTLLAAAGGCFDLDLSLGPGFMGGGGSCDWFCSDPYWLHPRSGFTTSLVGDTVRVQVGFDGTVEASSWRVTGRSLRIVDGDSTVTQLARRSSSVLLYAGTAGVDTVSAQVPDTARRLTLVLKAVDSSAITGIAVGAPQPYVVRLGERFVIWASLTEATGLSVTWTTPTFTVSDTTIAVADGLSPPAYGTSLYFKPLREGEVDITLQFGQIRKTVRVAVRAA